MLYWSSVEVRGLYVSSAEVRVLYVSSAEVRGAVQVKCRGEGCCIGQVQR